MTDGGRSAIAMTTATDWSLGGLWDGRSLECLFLYPDLSSLYVRALYHLLCIKVVLRSRCFSHITSRAVQGDVTAAASEPVPSTFTGRSLCRSARLGSSTGRKHGSVESERPGMPDRLLRLFFEVLVYACE
ncbi:unnamed protein product [Soboliphyme baturini]|uniref:Uncharacterized protein n=1 Tax=Soboliphyme baturini TaxID=241478 RepID=A0A183II06_9BILA|nr:unnamed protein product [Soboliphyme baturini]